MRNKVYLIGAGPGKPDLITLRGLNILRQAEVIIYDYLVDKQILNEAGPQAELVCCDKLGKKRYSDGFLVHNEKMNGLVIKKAKEGKRVVRLKSGDPSIFSRTSQELGALVKEGIDFEIVPGVTAANAASCLSGIPLTDRIYASSCAFATGHEDPLKKESSLDWQALSKSGTIVLYMAVETLPKIIKKLISVGKSLDTPVAVIQDVSLPTQKTVTGTFSDILKKTREEKIRPPAIVIIGEAVKLEKEFNWMRKSRKVLYTGISEERFFDDGMFFHLPLIKIVPLKGYRELDNLLKRLSAFDWIIFCSRYGVQYFFERLKRKGLDARALSKIKIAAIGNSTSRRLADCGIRADLVPGVESSQGLLEEFEKLNIRDKKILLPRSDLSDKGLERGFKKQGAKVTSVVVYRNVMPDELPDLNLNFFDEIMFTSPSTVKNFKKRYGRVPKQIRLTWIGEVTKKAIKRFLT